MDRNDNNDVLADMNAKPDFFGHLPKDSQIIEVVVVKFMSTMPGLCLWLLIEKSTSYELDAII
jgi:hypothetical protein